VVTIGISRMKLLFLSDLQLEKGLTRGEGEGPFLFLPKKEAPEVRRQRGFFSEGPILLRPAD